MIELKDLQLQGNRPSVFHAPVPEPDDYLAAFDKAADDERLQSSESSPRRMMSKDESAVSSDCSRREPGFSYVHWERMAKATSTRNRVPAHSSTMVTLRIRHSMEERVEVLSRQPHEIAQRLRELDEEWDIERAIEANAATLALAGLGLAVLHDRRWLALPALVSVFLLQHAVQGWCPPVPVLRRMEFRTADEINEERTALKALRGDFRGSENEPNRALRATHSGLDNSVAE